MIMPLHHLKPGQSARVVEIKSTDPARLDRLSAFGLTPGSWVRVEQVRPAFIFRMHGTEISVDEAVAQGIVVQVD